MCEYYQTIPSISDLNETVDLSNSAISRETVKSELQQLGELVRRIESEIDGIV